jgi:molybdopterin molybdotransferase
LTLAGAIYAGVPPGDLRIEAGQAVEVTTGAPLPEAADAVISAEDCRREDNQIVCFNTAHHGRNTLQRGTDVSCGEALLAKGDRVSAPVVGLLAAAGHANVRVYRPPRVLVIATGDEVVAPGAPLQEGQLYASNMMEIQSWLKAFGVECNTEIVSDQKAKIQAVINGHLDRTDVFLTSGGAWGSERDLMLRVVEKMNWRGIYHRVRMSPGKPVGFGILDERPFFILPGGPPSNEMAFLQLALPAISKMMGASPQIFPTVPARLESGVSGSESWTHFIHADLKHDGSEYTIAPIRLPSRLKSMAVKNAVGILPEGIRDLEAGTTVKAQIL